MTMKWHQLKTTPTHFQDVWDGRKKAEVRNTIDRVFNVEETLVLDEFDPESESYTGRRVVGSITHVLRGPGYGIAKDYAVISFENIVCVEDCNKKRIEAAE